MTYVNAGNLQSTDSRRAFPSAAVHHCSDERHPQRAKENCDDNGNNDIVLKLTKARIHVLNERHEEFVMRKCIVGQMNDDICEQHDEKLSAALSQAIQHTRKNMETKGGETERKIDQERCEGYLV